MCRYITMVERRNIIYVYYVPIGSAYLQNTNFKVIISMFAVIINYVSGKIVCTFKYFTFNM